ncbi:MAG TPA: ankyrin repeat domain-containing protein [Thermoanaerobaculia bacterium]|nr:ankyrin repeat domain-containing protein [Thermoanaerobaculia bacterium]
MSSRVEIPSQDPRAVALVTAIQQGDLTQLRTFLDEDPQLATARIVDEHGVARSLLHIVADWPGHWPNGAQTVALLARYGAEVNARVHHPYRQEARETPLHWVASNDDVAVLDALLDAGASIEISGAVFTGGTPMSDAVIFAQWNAARRLRERGAIVTFWQAAALGLLDEVRKHFTADSSPTPPAITNAFWNACRGGHRHVAEFLLERGADPHQVAHDDKTPLDVAGESGNAELVEWLRSLPAQ